MFFSDIDFFQMVGQTYKHTLAQCIIAIKMNTVLTYTGHTAPALSDETERRVPVIVAPVPRQGRGERLDEIEEDPGNDHVVVDGADGRQDEHTIAYTCNTTATTHSNKAYQL